MRTASKEQRARAGDPRRIEYRDNGDYIGLDSVRADPEVDSEAGTVSGYLSAFWVVDSYGTAFAPGAFDKTISERADKFHLLYQHNPDWSIGKLTNVETDSIGLRHSSTVIDDGAEGTTCLKRLRGGVPFGHSHGFRTIQERQATPDDPLIFSENTPEWVRRDPSNAYVITEVKLYEGSIVTFSSNDLAVITDVRTDVGLQALSDALEALQQGRVSTAQRSLIAEIVRAWEAAPELHPQPPRTSEESRGDREAALEVLFAASGISLSDVLSMA